MAWLTPGLRVAASQTAGCTLAQVVPRHATEALVDGGAAEVGVAGVDARHIVSRACTSSNGFISGMVRWKFIFGQEDVELLFF